MSDMEQHKSACLERWNRLKEQALHKHRLLRAKNITRADMEQWLKSQSATDERTLRKMLNRMRGR